MGALELLLTIAIIRAVDELVLLLGNPSLLLPLVNSPAQKGAVGLLASVTASILAIFDVFDVKIWVLEGLR